MAVFLKIGAGLTGKISGFIELGGDNPVNYLLQGIFGSLIDQLLCTQGCIAVGIEFIVVPGLEMGEVFRFEITADFIFDIILQIIPEGIYIPVHFPLGREEGLVQDHIFVKPGIHLVRINNIGIRVIIGSTLVCGEPVGIYIIQFELQFIQGSGIISIRSVCAPV